MSEKQNYDVFLSYSHQDRSWAAQFADALIAAGIRPWLAESQLQLGEKWKDRLEQALRDASTLVCILSPKSVDSPQIFFELGAAMAGRKRIIPVIAEELDPKNAPPFIMQFQALHETSPQEAGKKVAEVLEAVGH